MSPRAPFRKSEPGLRAVAAWVADDSAIFASQGSPFYATLSAEGSPRLLVVTGENASGKSLFVRMLCHLSAKHHGLLPVSVSVRERTGSGMRQAFMFGDEQTQSTGATTVSAIRRALENNLDRPQGSLLVVDEPELGLSEGYAAALGAYIGQGLENLPDACRGVVVVTHSRPLVRALWNASPLEPTHVAVGQDAVVGIEAWLDQTETRTVDELLALEDIGLERFRQAHRLSHG